MEEFRENPWLNILDLVAPAKHGVELRRFATVWLDAFRVLFNLPGLHKRNTQGLCSHGGGSRFQVGVLLAQLFDFILTRLFATKWSL